MTDLQWLQWLLLAIELLSLANLWRINRRVRRNNRALREELEGWYLCRVQFTVDGHRYLDSTLMQMREVQADSYEARNGVLPPMEFVVSSRANLTVFGLPRDPMPLNRPSQPPQPAAGLPRSPR